MYSVKINGIRTNYPHGLNKVQSSVRTPEFNMKHLKKAKGCIIPKCCEYNNETEDNTPNTLSDKKYKAVIKEYFLPSIQHGYIQRHHYPGAFESILHGSTREKKMRFKNILFLTKLKKTKS